MKTFSRYLPDRNEGLTLAELMITVVIIGVLASIAAPGMNRFFQKAQLENALLRMQGALRETQSEAIRRSQTCTLVINPGVDQAVTGNCLVTGDRPLKGIHLKHSQGLSVDPWTITFDARGRNQNFNDPGTAVLSIPGASSVSPKCMVISIGIGLHRIGEYEGDLTLKPAGRYCVTS